MKEASGELNMTVFVVTVVAALGVFFFTIIWPAIRNNMASNTKCSDAICSSEKNADGTVDCVYIDRKGNKSEEFTCVCKV